jgi:hypothetical protein
MLFLGLQSQFLGYFIIAQRKSEVFLKLHLLMKAVLITHILCFFILNKEIY